MFLNPLKRVALELKSKDALKLSVEILVLLILSIKEPKPNLPEELPFKLGKKLPFAMATSFSASSTLNLFCWIEMFLINAWSTASFNVHFFCEKVVIEVHNTTNRMNLVLKFLAFVWY